MYYLYCRETSEVLWEGETLNDIRNGIIELIDDNKLGIPIEELCSENNNLEILTETNTRIILDLRIEDEHESNCISTDPSKTKYDPILKEYI